MNAVSLYVTASRLIFSSLKSEDAGKWSDINRLIVFLRQSLTCCVCGNLLSVPCTSAVAHCQHHVCKQCIGGKRRLKPSCSSCKDQSRFQENVQLRVLLQCYKKLCTYVSSTDIPIKWGSMTVSCANGPTPAAVSASASHGVGALISGPTTFYQLIEEGANLSDKFAFNASSAAAPNLATGQPATGIRTKSGIAAAATGPAAATRPLISQPHTKSAAAGAAAALLAKAQAQAAKRQQQQAAIAMASGQQGGVAVTTTGAPPASKKLKTQPAAATGATAVLTSAPLVPAAPASTSSAPVGTSPHAPAAHATSGPEESMISIAARELDQMDAAAAVSAIGVAAGQAAAIAIPNPQLGSGLTVSTIADLKQKLPPAIDIQIPDPLIPLISSPSPVLVSAAPHTLIAAQAMDTGTPADQTFTPLVANSGNKKPGGNSGSGGSSNGKRRGCRCGLATPNPGKLTCCGQRCPCYVDGKGCFDCKCRGCRNPHKANTNSGIPVIPAVKPNLNTHAQTAAAGLTNFPAAKAAPSTAPMLTTAAPDHSQSAAAGVKVATSGDQNTAVAPLLTNIQTTGSKSNTAAVRQVTVQMQANVNSSVNQTNQSLVTGHKVANQSLHPSSDQLVQRTAVSSSAGITSVTLSAGALTSNAAIMNTLQSNGVTCKLVTVTGHGAQQQLLHRPGTITLTAAASSGTSGTSSASGIFLSPSICLINTTTAAASAPSVSLPVRSFNPQSGPRPRHHQQQ